MDDGPLARLRGLLPATALQAASVRPAQALSSSPSWPVTSLVAVGFDLAMLPHHITQHSGCLNGLQSAVELHRGSYVAVAQEAADRLVIAWMGLPRFRGEVRTWD